MLLSVLLLSISSVCGLLRTSSPDELYENFLNLKLPNNVNDFEGEGRESFLVFASKAYFTYRTETPYFEILENHDHFIEKSDFNEKIHVVRCNSNEFTNDFSYWTDTKIGLDGKSCFTGVFFPFVHYIVYDPMTKETHHFVTGMRE